MTVAIVFSVISLCVSVLSFFFFRWYIRRETAVTQQLEVYRKEVDGLIAAIDTVTDRDSMLVEERVKTLKKVLEDTDKRIAVFLREVQRNRSGEALYDSLGRGIRAALDSRPHSKEQPSLFPAEPMSPPGATPRVTMPVAETSAATENEVHHVAEEAADKKQKSKPKRTQALTEKGMDEKSARSKLKVQIAEMSASGTPPQEIASTLDISIAEVDLAINLLNRPAS